MYTRGKESKVIKKMQTKDFPGSPGVRSPRFHCRERGFDPWSGTEILQATKYSYCGEQGTQREDCWVQSPYIYVPYWGMTWSRSLHLSRPVSPCVHVCLVAQSCSTLCDPMDCSPPGSSIHGILQARILGWSAIPFSRAYS